MTEKISIDKSWTLFLDRDGVINERLMDDYVKNINEFIFLDGVLESFRIFNELFNRIIIVTNQRGIALNVMNQSDLESIHRFMVEKIRNNGGRVDSIYHCPHDKNDNCNCRKPNNGMLLQAYADFNDIDFSKSIMVGDTEPDMEMGRSKCKLNIFISERMENTPLADMVFPSLSEFARHLKGE